MSYEIIPTDNFSREAKKLAKKYVSLKADLQKLSLELEKNPTLGKYLGSNVYKIRMAISSKSKGKSGGARIISYVYIENQQVILLSIYDKSEKETITDNEIKLYLANLTL